MVYLVPRVVYMAPCVVCTPTPYAATARIHDLPVVPPKPVLSKFVVIMILAVAPIGCVDHMRSCGLYAPSARYMWPLCGLYAPCVVCMPPYVACITPLCGLYAPMWYLGLYGPCVVYMAHVWSKWPNV